MERRVAQSSRAAQLCTTTPAAQGSPECKRETAGGSWGQWVPVAQWGIGAVASAAGLAVAVLMAPGW